MKPSIDKTKFGSITIEGDVFEHDVLILHDGKVRKRKKKLSKAIYGTSHTISLDEAKYIYDEDEDADRLIIGTGQYDAGRSVSAPDLDDAAARWPLLVPFLLHAGIHAVFAFPLQLGTIRLGALDLHCHEPGDLRVEQYDDARIVADVVTNALHELQAAATGALAPELEHAETLRIEVHQASGIIAAQLDVPVGDALVRLRARAYADGRPVNDVARDVIARTLRIE